MIHRLHWPSIFAWLVAKRLALSFFSDKGVVWSSSVAFYLVLSVPPLVIAGVSIALAVVGPQQAQALLGAVLSQFLPKHSGQLNGIVHTTVSGSGLTALVSIVFLLFTGTQVFAFLTRGINSMWHATPNAGFMRRQILRLVLLLLVGGLFVLAAALTVIGRHASLPGWLLGLLQSQVIPVILIGIGLLVTYKLIPYRRASWSTALLAATLGTFALRIAQAIFTLFLQLFGGFRSAYGPLASVAVLMTWAFIGSVIVLAAAELVAVLNRHSIPNRKRIGG